MNDVINGKRVSLDHLSIGARRSGSYNGDADVVVGMFEGFQEDREVLAWASTAKEGDTFQLGGGVFLTCW